VVIVIPSLHHRPEETRDALIAISRQDPRRPGMVYPATTAGRRIVVAQTEPGEAGPLDA
jgi:hypothetical protein